MCAQNSGFNFQKLETVKADYWCSLLLDPFDNDQIQDHFQLVPSIYGVIHKIKSNSVFLRAMVQGGGDTSRYTNDTLQPTVGAFPFMLSLHH